MFISSSSSNIQNEEKKKKLNYYFSKYLLRKNVTNVYLNAKAMSTIVNALRITSATMNTVFDPTALGFIKIKIV